MKSGFILWLITILSFAWGVGFGVLGFKAAAENSSKKITVFSAIAAEYWSIIGFIICGICLIIRGIQVV